MSEENKNVLTACSIVGIVCTSIGFFICWWLGFIGAALCLIGMTGDKKTAVGGLLFSIIEIIVSIVVFISVGIL